MILLLRSVLSMKNWSSQVILKIWCGIAIISVTRGSVGVKFPEKMHYITLEWPLIIIYALNVLSR